MKRIDVGRYEVTPRERITIAVTPIEVGENFVSIASDGDEQEDIGGATPTHRFTARATVGDRNVAKVQCSFPGDTPDTARFVITIRGTTPPNDDDTITVKKTDDLHEPEFRFKVV